MLRRARRAFARKVTRFGHSWLRPTLRWPPVTALLVLATGDALLPVTALLVLATGDALLDATGDGPVRTGHR